MKNFGFLVFCVLSLSFYNCSSDDSSDGGDGMNPGEIKQTIFGVFEANESSNEIIMQGIISENTSSDLEDLLTEYPNTNLVFMLDVDGATSSNAAFTAGLVVRDAGLDVRIADNSTITREAVDFMLGGINRSKGVNAQLSVGAWRNEQGQTPSDFPFGHEVHLPWINFYQQVGFQFQLATDFYNFWTVVAGPDEEYFLSDDEIDTFNLLN